MHKIDQEFFYDKGEIGDCVRACTASVLDLECSDVPHFVRDAPGSDWYDTWEKFMISHGTTPIMVHGPWERPPTPTGYYLASGPSARGCSHMVVMWNGEVAHDPYPSRVGLLEIEAIWILA